MKKIIFILFLLLSYSANAKEKIESLFVEWETASTELETLKEKYPL